jgi:hypothetical protein
MHSVFTETITTDSDFEIAENQKKSSDQDVFSLKNTIDKVRKLVERISSWEQWPFAIIYAPLSFMWLYYMIKARAVWFFSNVNPTLEFSGFEGESKKEMYEQLPRKYYPNTFFVNYQENISDVEKKIEQQGFTYPLVVKPQIGMHAMLFRKIENSTQLNNYHSYVDVDYMIQEYIDMPVELSVFHIRYPGQKKGFITGFILKNYLTVTGDGNSTLEQLIQNHSKARHRLSEMKKRHRSNLDVIIPKEQQYFLSIAGNHNRGARFTNLSSEIDERLCNVFDGISNGAGHFYFGRYDLKCASIEDLKAGKNFYILEYNGAGAEPNHIYDCGMNYFTALSIIKMHWHHLYKISRINFKNGIPYWNFIKGLKYLSNAKNFFKKMRATDFELANSPE